MNLDLFLQDQKEISKETFPTLYSRDKNGGVRQWSIEVEGDKFRVTYGMVGGKLIVSEWTVCEGKNTGKKNATTGEQQAYSEAKSEWKKTLESGYWEKVEDIDNERFFDPMCCERYDERENLVVEHFSSGGYVYVQPKLDGMRATSKSDETLTTRGGKLVVCAPHIIKALNQIHSAYPNVIIDGELYNHQFSQDFEELMSVFKQQKPTPDDFQKSEKYGQYWVFDIFVKDQPDMPYEQRFEFLKEIWKKLKIGLPLKLVWTLKITNQKDLDEANIKYIKDKFEGQIIRFPDKPYQNRRTVDVLKRKEFHDEEFILADITPGKGKRANMFGRAICYKSGNSGDTFEANAWGNDVFYKYVLTHKSEFIGKSVTVRYQNLTKDGKPRFGRVIKWAREDYEGIIQKSLTTPS